MAADTAKVGRKESLAGELSPAELIDRLSRFQGPPGEFLTSLLAVQCRLASAGGGAILRSNPAGRVEVIAIYPAPAEGATAPVWLAEAAEAAAKTGSAGVTVRGVHGPDDLYGQPARRHLVMIPLRSGQGIRGAAAFLVETADKQALAASREKLELTSSLLSLYEMQLTLARRQADLRRLRTAAEILTSVNQHERFAGAAMAMCNEVAARFRCERASLGFLKGRYVQLKALSHTEKFSRKMKIVQDIESAMEECIDQDVEVTYPPPAQVSYFSRSAGDLSKRHGPTAVLSLPLRSGGEAIAVLTVERAIDAPLSLEEAESLRLTCELCTPTLALLREHDRWFGAKAASGLRKALASAFGAKHTWLKAAAVCVLAALLFMIFAKGDYNADASFVLAPTRQELVSAQFDGVLREVYVTPGDEVVGDEGQPSWLLEAGDIRDLPGLLAAIRAAAQADAPSPGKRIWAMLSDELRQYVEASGTKLPGDVRDVLRKELNALLAMKDFYAPAAWGSVELSLRQKDLLDLWKDGELTATETDELNRSLLASAFGDEIAPGPTVLAQLDTRELRAQLLAAQLERGRYLKEASDAASKDKIAQADIARNKAEEVQKGQINRLTELIERARLVAPLTGTVISEDLKRQLGTAVKKGDPLFEVADLTSLRAELAVPEDQIADIIEKQEGKLAATSYPALRVPFIVERIEPLAKVVEGKNVYNVRVQLLQMQPWMRPGMEGVAKVTIDRRPYAVIWTRKLVNWFRMKLWL